MAQKYDVFQIRPISKNINREIYGITIKKEIAIKMVGEFFTQSISGNAIVLTRSGGVINETNNALV